MGERSLKAEANPGVGSSMLGVNTYVGEANTRGTHKRPGHPRAGWVPGMLWLEV